MYLIEGIIKEGKMKTVDCTGAWKRETETVDCTGAWKRETETERMKSETNRQLHADEEKEFDSISL